MLNISKLISLPVISVYDGQIVGIVKNILFSPKKLKAAYAQILSDDENIEMILQFKNIYKIGDDAILIKNKHVLELYLEKENQLKNYYNPITCPLFSVSGVFISNVKDITIDDKYNIINIETYLSNIIKVASLLNFSNNCTILHDSDKKYKLGNFKQRKTIKILENERKVTLQQNLEEDSINLDDIKNLTSENNVLKVQQPSKLIADYRFLINRKVKKTLLTSNGELIIKENDIITKHVIEFARKNGKLVELTHYSEF